MPNLYTSMKTFEVDEANEIGVRNIQAYMERVVTKFGSGAKVEYPREFMARKIYIIIEGDEKWRHLSPSWSIH